MFKADPYDVIVKEIQRLVKHLGGRHAIFAMEMNNETVITYWNTAKDVESKLSDSTYLACHLIKNMIVQVEEDEADNSSEQ